MPRRIRRIEAYSGEDHLKRRLMRNYLAHTLNVAAAGGIEGADQPQ
jgi:hypothetical protein